MVSTASLAAILFSLLVSILLPLGLVVVLWIWKRISLWSVVVGALVFLVFQLLTRIPLLNALSTQPWFRQMAENPLLIGLFLSLTAGLFEEIGRWLAFRFVLKDRRQIKNGVAYGVGHGGFESVVLVGLTYINNLVYANLINSGQFETLIAPQLGPAAETLRQQLVESPPLLFASAGVERIFAITLQIALSLVVLLGVRRGKFLYVIYAILLHALVNFPIVLLPRLENGILYSELYLFVVFLASLAYIIFIWRQYEGPGAVTAPLVEEESADLHE